MRIRSHRSILRTLAVRIALCSAFCLIVAVFLLDIRWYPRATPSTIPAPDVNSPAGGAWPQLRGPTYDAHSDESDLANAWPASGPPILWTREIGPGYSAFIAQGNRVYTQTQRVTEQTVLALDADTGQPLWEHAYAWPYQAGGMFPGPRATPTLSNGRIYFAAPSGLVGCLDAAANGHPLWSVNVLERFGGRGAEFGYAASPVVERGLIVLPVGGASASVVALDATNGATRWASGSAPASYCSALPITFRGRRQIAVFLQNTLAGFDLESGRQLWEQIYPRGFEEHAAALLYDEPYLRVMQAYRAGSDLYELQPGTPAESTDGIPATHIQRLRHDAQMSNDVAASVLVNGYLYGFDLRDMQAAAGRPSRGTFRCLDFKTGQLRWSSDAPGQSTLLAADGKLFMLNDRGQALLVRANPDRYEELARADVFPGETCWTAPALHRGRLLLRSPTRAACLFVANPARMTARQRALAAGAATNLATGHVKPPGNFTWLVGAEREAPFELPDLPELTRWYAASLVVLVAAALIATTTAAILRRLNPRSSQTPTTFVFHTALFALGFLATSFANHYTTHFIFTWPLSVLVTHQVALAAASSPKLPEPRKRTDFRATAAATLLILTCLFYFKLTRLLHLAPAWYFLALLPAAWPLAIPAARQLRRHPLNVRTQFLWTLVVFTLYFWSTAAVMLARTFYVYHVANRP